MTPKQLTPELLELVAERLKAIAEPARLQLLAALRDGERSVGELVDETGLGQANASKHLQILHGRGFISRRKEGLHVFYSLADRDVFRICDMMCGRIEAEMEDARRMLAGS